jgi:hypothetical protein
MVCMAAINDFLHLYSRPSKGKIATVSILNRIFNIYTEDIINELKVYHAVFTNLGY